MGLGYCPVLVLGLPMGAPLDGRYSVGWLDDQVATHRKQRGGHLGMPVAYLDGLGC